MIYRYTTKKESSKAFNHLDTLDVTDATMFPINIDFQDRLNDEIHSMRQALAAEEKRRKAAENELINIKKVVPECEDGFEVSGNLWALFSLLKV